jgi:hypothetical protein
MFALDNVLGRGSGRKNVIFSNRPYDQSKYSDPLICANMISIKFHKKKMSERGPLGVSKSTFFFGGILSGLSYRNFASFHVVSTQYAMLMTPYHTPISKLILL